MRRLPGHLLQTLEKLAKSGITEGFYLAGGTAIALKYNHRISIDLDFFTFPGKRMDAEHILRLAGQAEVVVQQPRTLVFFSKPEQTKVSFFEYDAPLIEEPVAYAGGIALASDVDVAAMKAAAIAQRGSKKDFFDLWFLMQKHGWTLSDLERALAVKYPSWNFGVFLRAMTYFEDAEKETCIDVEPFWEEVKDYFRSLVAQDTNLIPEPEEEDPGPSLQI